MFENVTSTGMANHILQSTNIKGYITTMVTQILKLKSVSIGVSDTQIKGTLNFYLLATIKPWHQWYGKLIGWNASSLRSSPFLECMKKIGALS